MRSILFMLLVLAGAPAAMAQQSYPAEMWRSDILFLQTELPKRYPDFFAHYPQAAWENNLRRVAEKCDGKSTLQIGLELQAVLARAHDSYLRMELTQQLQTTRVIPLGFGWFNGNYYVSGTIKKFENTLGRKLLKINGMAPDTALDKIRLFLSVENIYGMRKDGPQWLRFPLALQMSGVSKNDTLTLTLETPSGEPENVKVYPVDFKSGARTAMMPAVFSPSNPDLRWQPLQGMYRTNWSAEDRILYFQMNYCASKEMAEANGDSLSALQLPPFTPMADSLIAFMETHPEARLFIDLRYNPGGSPADGIRLAQRIGENKEINKKGRIFIGINGYTTAAPLEIAEAFRKYTNAQLIGEPTAERPIHTGPNDSFKLPRTGLMVFYPVAFRPQPKNTRDALYPDIPVEMTFEAFKTGRDPVMDYIRKVE